MLGSIRKFSSSIYAKVFLFIVAIPFVFWGMGDLFFSGNKNTIVKIDNNKISTQEFINFIQKKIFKLKFCRNFTYVEKKIRQYLLSI